MSIPTSFIYPEKLKPGDNVAILSPSSGMAGQIPHIFELGLQRLRQHFNLVQVEYPTTRVYSTPQERAYDIFEQSVHASPLSLKASKIGVQTTLNESVSMPTLPCPSKA